ncbi:hydrolase [Clostridium tyrobutyricum]|jgi:lysophospholipase L1-like esterase|uniref:Probable tesA-like protease n=1 Tax=Clostridium tyrobutyricum DIVETGP TaxID=1408889 RepID=W6N736_CLOTY|nr:GDSL-type esterase/lipase family protein [Clostridium tyrobutyricum]AND85636.1 TesA-like protease [Clostridium tyrobutyricum]ANP70160.1 hydrolase [Clostridium tyrobutyricum]MBV4433690.1 hydrolase [Clostridium tyrobutyricum]MCH4199955.1 GDSL-type esterase/lipase family protein [Clostridium tyrobutyricum]MCH4237624.1 GDSL-type esterase/lipase family protein [Clostridium tyrobutyricum]
MKLVCIGDSLTTGYGVSMDVSWISIVKNSLKINIINKGINGDTTAGMLSRSFRDVVEKNPTHSFIMGGCNDIMNNYSLNIVEDNLYEIIKESLNHNIIPILGIEPPVIGELAILYWGTDSNYDLINKNQILYRKWIIDICNKNTIEYIDFFKLFSSKLKSLKPESLYIDGVHPSKLGHELMSNLAISRLNKILNL